MPGKGEKAEYQYSDWVLSGIEDDDAVDDAADHHGSPQPATIVLEDHMPTPKTKAEVDEQVKVSQPTEVLVKTPLLVTVASPPRETVSPRQQALTGMNISFDLSLLFHKLLRITSSLL